MYSKTRLLGCLFASFAAFALSAKAQTYTWSGSGNWSTPTNWTPNGTPGTGDAVIYGSTSTSNCTIDSYANGNVATITVSAGYTGQITLGANVTITGNLTIQAGTLDTDANNNYALTVNGNYVQSGGLFYARASTVTVGGAFENTAANGFRGGTSSIILTGSGNLYNNYTSSAGAFYNLSVAASGQTTTATSSHMVLNILTLGTGTLTAGSTYKFWLYRTAGAPCAGGGGTYSSNIIFGHNAVTTIAGLNYSNARVSGNTGGGTLTVGGNLTCGVFSTNVSNDFLVVIDTAGYTINCSSISIGYGSSGTGAQRINFGASTVNCSGNLTYANSSVTVSATTANINIGGNWDNTKGGTMSMGASTVTFNGSSSSGTITSGGKSFHHVTVNGSGASKWTMQDALTVGGNLTVQGGGLDTNSTSNYGLTVTGNVLINGGVLAANASAIGVAGNWSRTSGTFTYGTSTVNFNGTSTVNGATGNDFYNLTASGSATLGSALDIVGSVTIEAGGTLDVSASNFALWVERNWANYGTFTARQGLVTLRNAGGSGAWTVKGPTTFYDLTFSMSGGIDWDLWTDLVVGHDLTISGSGASERQIGTRTGEIHTITVGGDVLHSGTGGWVESSLTIKLAGSSGQTVGVTSTGKLGGLEIANTTSTVTLSGTLVTGDSGDLTIDTGATLDVTTSNHRIVLSGDWMNAGTFNARTGTVEFKHTSNLTAVTIGATTFYNLIFTVDTYDYWDLAGDIDVSNDFTIQGTESTGYTLVRGRDGESRELRVAGNATHSTTCHVAGSVVLVMNGSAAQTVSATSTGKWGALKVTNTSAPVSLGSNVTLSGHLTIESGSTLDATTSNRSLTVTGNLTFAEGATFIARSGKVKVETTTNGWQQDISPKGASFNEFEISLASAAYTALVGQMSVSGTMTISGGGAVKLLEDVTASGPYRLTGSVVTEGVGTGAILHPSEDLRFTDSSGTTVTTYTSGGTIPGTPGDVLYVTAEDQDENRGTGAQTVTVILTTSGGDSETKTLTETGGLTGIFRNTTSFKTWSYSGSPALGNGTLEVNPGEDIMVTYTDSRDASDVRTSKLGGNNSAPTAVASVSPTGAQDAPVKLSFTGSNSTDSDGTIAAYLWSFGDGTTSTVANPTHLYEKTGEYTATLTVTDNLGAKGETTLALSITAATGNPKLLLLSGTLSATSPGLVEVAVSENTVALTLTPSGGSAEDMTRLAATRGYKYMTLSATAGVGFTVSGTSATGSAQIVDTLVWSATDIAAQSGQTLSIRAGDYLLLTATGTGTTLEIDGDGDNTYEKSGAPGDKFEQQYATAGTYTVRAKIDGSVVGTITVKAIGVTNFPTALAALVSEGAYTTYTFTVSPSAESTSVGLEYISDAVTRGRTEASGVVTAKVGSVGKTLSGVAARIGEGAGTPILADENVTGFTVKFTTDVAFPVMKKYANGDVLIMSTVHVDPADARGGTATAGIGSGPATFADSGTQSTTFSLNDLNPFGDFNLGIVASVDAASCHYIWDEWNNVWIKDCEVPDSRGRCIDSSKGCKNGQCKSKDKDEAKGKKNKKKKCKDFLNNPEGCRNQTCPGCEFIPGGDEPDALPSLGAAVGLRASIASSLGQNWGVAIGFGKHVSLNHLVKLHLTAKDADGVWQFARVYDPAEVTTYSFEYDATSGKYLRTYKARGYGADAKVEFTGTPDANGVKPTARLLHEDGRVWEFTLEGYSAVKHEVAGPVYRITKRQTKEGHATTFVYNTGNVAITDASGHVYTCYYDGANRITKIDVNGQASWTYYYNNSGHYGDTTITESNGRTGETVATQVNPEGNIEQMSRYGGGISSTETWEYDSYGNVTRWVQDGVVTTRTRSVNGEIETIDLTTAGRTERMIYDSTGVRTAIEDPAGLALTTSYVKNEYHRSTQVTDERGKVWTNAFDSNGYLTRSEDPEGAVWTYAYDSNYNLLTKVTPAGTWTYEYDSSNRMTKETAPDTGVTTYAYDSNGNMTLLTGPRGEKTDFEYNGSGQVTKKYGPYFSTKPTEYVAYAYDSWGNLTRETDENGNYTAFEYNAQDQMTRRYCPVGCNTTYEFDGLRRKTKETDATGAFTTWTYDSRGFVTKIGGSSAGGGGGCSGCGQASGAGGVPGDYYYDDGHLLTRFTDLNIHDTYHYYDAAGRQTKTKDARNFETLFVLDGSGNQTAVTDANNHTTTFTYSDANRLLTVTNAENETTTYAYDLAGRQTLVTDAESATQYTHYDSMGRVTKVKDPLNRETLYAYDLGGNLTLMTDAEDVETEYEYDAQGLLTKTIRDAGDLAIEETRDYDAAGRLTLVTDDLGHETVYAYDTGNRLTKVTSDLGKETTYSYDAVGRQTLVTDGASRYVSTTYNAAGWVTQTSNGVTSTSFCYDNVGNRTCVTVSGRAPVTYSYDVTNNLTGTSQTSGSVTITTSQVVDGVGLVTSSTDGENKETTYEYDGANRLTLLTNPQLEETAYAYDDVGRQTLVTFDNGHTRGFAYDAAGQLTQTTGGPEGTKTYAYDDVGRQTSVTDANSLSRTTEYDTLGRVISQSNEMSQAVTYAYDRTSRMTALTDANTNTTDYEYNADNQLTKMTYPEVSGQDANEESYVYDDGGLLITKVTCNGTSITYGYNGAGQRSSVNFGTTVSYSYDSAGAVTSITGLGSMQYGYDGFGRATVVVDGTAARTINYGYDKRGLRTQLVLDGTGGQSINYAYSDAGRLSTVQKGGDSASTYSYDIAGLRTNLALPNSVGTAYQYDTSDRLTSLTTGSLASFAVERDDTGNIDSITFVDGSVSTYGYDLAYRLTQDTRTKDSTTVYQDKFYYDNVGNRTRRETLNLAPYGSDSSTKLLFHMEEAPTSDTAHDSSGNGHNGAVGGDATFVQNGYFGRAAQFGTGCTSVITISDHADLEMGTLAFTVEAWIKPDTTHLPATILSKWNETAGNRSYMLSINSSGYLEGSVYKDSTDNGTIVSNGTLATDTWVHVAMERVEGGTLQLYVNGTLQTQTVLANYSLENNFESVRIGAAGDDQDLTDQLVGLVDEVRISTVARGENLRKTATDYVYNARNQLVTATTGDTVLKYFYNKNGCQTKIEEWVDDTHLSAQDQTFGYDALNRLTSYSGPRGSESYSYRGAEWHRASTTVDGTTTTFLYDGDNVLADLEGSAVKKFYVTPFLDQNLSMTITDGDNAGTYYYSQDWLGSVRTLTDSSGNLKDSYDYSAFGEKLAAGTSEQIAIRKGYSGRETNFHSDWMYYRYRGYSPALGRFNNRNPWGYIQLRMNLYDYVNSNSVRFIEPYSSITDPDQPPIYIPPLPDIPEPIWPYLEPIPEHVTYGSIPPLSTDDAPRGAKPGTSGDTCCCIEADYRMSPKNKWSVYQAVQKGNRRTLLGFKIFPRFKVIGNPDKCKYSQIESGLLQASINGGPWIDALRKTEPDKNDIPSAPMNRYPLRTLWSFSGWYEFSYDAFGLPLEKYNPRPTVSLGAMIVNFKATFLCEGTDGSKASKTISINGDKITADMVNGQPNLQRVNPNTVNPVVVPGTP